MNSDNRDMIRAYINKRRITSDPTKYTEAGGPIVMGEWLAFSRADLADALVGGDRKRRTALFKKLEEDGIPTRKSFRLPGMPRNKVATVVRVPWREVLTEEECWSLLSGKPAALPVESAYHLQLICRPERPRIKPDWDQILREAQAIIDSRKSKPRKENPDSMSTCST